IRLPASEGEGAGGGTRLLPRGRRAGAGAGCGCREKPKRVLPAIFVQQKGWAANYRPPVYCLLGRFLRGLGSGLQALLGLFFDNKLLLHFEGYGIGVYLVRTGSITEDRGRIRPRGRQQDTCLHQQPRERALVGAAQISGKGLADFPVIALLPDAVLPRQHFKARFVHEDYQLLDDEKQIALHQTDGNGCTHSGEDTNAGRVGDSLFIALLLLVSFPLLIFAVARLLRMMNLARRIRTDLMHGAHVGAFGNDGLGGEFAHLELGPLGLFFGLGLLVSNCGVLVSWKHLTSLPRFAVSGADLD